jgi:hypothetical protein
MTDLTKRFQTMGNPFNTGWLTRDIEVYQANGEHTFWNEHNDMELHDDVDHIVTYDQDATMIFQPAHPQYKTNHYSRWDIFTPTLTKSLKTKGDNLDLWAFNAPVVCQNFGSTQTQPPESSPTESFNNRLLTAAVTTTGDNARAGMEYAERGMTSTNDLLIQGGITIKNLDIWFAATNKTRAVQQLYLEFPEASSSGRYTRREKTHPDSSHQSSRQKSPPNVSPNPRPLYQLTSDLSNVTLARSERMIFQIMSGITLGAIRFKRERDLNTISLDELK